jgi:hypothetical protein
MAHHDRLMVEQTAYAHLPDEGLPHEAKGAREPIQQERSLPKMRNDTASSGEFRINLPPDVVAEMRRQTLSARAAMQVDGFRPGIFSRLIGLVTGRRR